MTRNPFFPFKTPTEFEDYGATIGGPIKTDKLFYLLGYEGQNEAIGNPTNTIVPTTYRWQARGIQWGRPLTACRMRSIVDPKGRNESRSRDFGTAT